MVARILLAALVLSLRLSAVPQSAPSAPTVLAAADLKKVVPDSYFFRGLSATTQLRNSAAIHYPDDYYVIAGLVDTSGYSSDVNAKYKGFFITEKKLRFDVHVTPRGLLLVKPNPLNLTRSSPGRQTKN